MITRLRELSARCALLRSFSELEKPEGGTSLVEDLIDLAALFRGLQLYAHNAHNLTSGQSFFEDHEFLGELYGTYEASYDKLIELMIGEGLSFGLPEIQSSALAFMQGMSRSEIFPELLDREKEIQYRINELSRGQTDQGLIQAVGTLAEESKARSYKIGRRVTGASEETKSFSDRLRELSAHSSRLRQFDSRPRNANGQYEPNIESGLTPDAMRAAYGTQEPERNVAAIDERVGGGESQLSRKIKAYRAKSIKAPAGEEAPGGGVGSGGTTL
jgi:DNA-binding ferritin-like protein